MNTLRCLPLRQALLLFCLLPLGLSAQKADAVMGVGITVSNLDRSVRFFTEVLDFKKIGEDTLRGTTVANLYGLADTMTSLRTAHLQLGDERIDLMQFGISEARPVPADSRSNDSWFQHIAIVVSDMDQAYAKLLVHKVEHVSTAPQTLPAYITAAAGIRAFYFHDPDGHNLELIWFPPGKGNPKWQPRAGEKPSGKTFLGIDHTAVGIADTDAALRFYRDNLGLEVGGHSENYGPEQERLNQVFGARLDITGLHTDQGFGVEFLRYIAPPGGRPYPTDSRPTDLWHWQTVLHTKQPEALFQRLETAGYQRISRKKTMLSGQPAMLFRDADGHAILLH